LIEIGFTVFVLPADSLSDNSAIVPNHAKEADFG